MRTHRGWQAFEAAVGLLATFFIGFAPPIVLEFGVVHSIVDRNLMMIGLTTMGFGITTMSAVLVAKSAQRAFDEFMLESNLETRTGIPVRDALLHQFDEDNEKGFEFGALGSPVAVKLAFRMGPGSWFLRPFLSLWWLAHFGAGAIIGFGAGHVVSKFVTPNQLLIGISLAIIVQVAFIFAVNLYLLLCLSTFTQSTSKLEMLWRWRIVIDLAVTAALFLSIDL